MMNDVEQRQSRVMDFINAKHREMDKINCQRSLDTDPTLKMRKLNEEYQNAPSKCIDAMLGRMYKNALPFDDPDRYCTDDEARSAVHDFISKRTDGHNSEWYVREALKRCNSSTLQSMLNESQQIAKNYYKETSKELPNLNVSDINFNPSAEENELDKIADNLDFDEISTIIHNNVQSTLRAEADKAKREEEYNQQIEDQLAADDSVVDDASMESAMAKLVKPVTVYQPSLMEAIMLNKASQITESAGKDDVMNEAIREYTKLSMAKALKLENFSLRSITELANSYCR